MRFSRTFALLCVAAIAGCSQHTASSSLPAVPVNAFGRVAPMGAGYKSLYSFKGNPDGSNPYGRMVAVNGALYGTTVYGGKYQFGILYKITTTGVEHLLHTFGNDTIVDGSEPYGGLIVLGGALYGTTYYGGHAPADHGAVFKSSTTGAEHLVCSFTESQGQYPYAGVVALNGNLYGTTHQGGAHNYGSVYGCTMSGKVSVLHSFALSPTARIRMRRWSRSTARSTAPRIKAALKITRTATASCTA